MAGWVLPRPVWLVEDVVLSRLEPPRGPHIYRIMSLCTLMPAKAKSSMGFTVGNAALCRRRFLLLASRGKLMAHKLRIATS